MKNVSTRLLMSCAAIGVAGGVLFTAHALIGGIAVNTVPFVYGLTMGVYFLPGVLAQALFRRPGVALLASTLAGLVSSPFQPIGFTALLIAIGVGVLEEAPFAIGRYRHWPAWLFWLSSALQGLLVMGAAFGIMRGQDLGTAGVVLLLVSFFISPPIFTGIALQLAERLDRAGVARGLRADEQRRNPNAPTT